MLERITSIFVRKKRFVEAGNVILNLEQVDSVTFYDGRAYVYLHGVAECSRLVYLTDKEWRKLRRRILRAKW